MNWYYHSRDPHYKMPFGAVRTNESVSFRIDGAPSALVELLLYLPEGPETISMQWDGSAYRASFTAPAVPCRMGYGFRIDGRYFGAASGEARNPAASGEAQNPAASAKAQYLANTARCAGQATC